MVPEGLALEDVGKVDLDHRQVGAAQRVVDRDRGMGIGAGIDDDAGRAAARLLDPVDELALVIRLAEVDGEAQQSGPLVAGFLDIAQGFAAIESRLAHAEQVEVGAVEDKDRRLGHGRSQSWLVRRPL